jgi:putative membrane protein
MIYNLLRGLHILAVIAWMAGLLYLPRLFAYHTRAAVGSEMDATFTNMEAKLLGIIMTPAMLAVILLGAGLVWFDATQQGWGWGFLAAPWMVSKLTGAIFLISWHFFLGRSQRRFAAGERWRTERFWRMTNELPFLAATVIVLSVTTKFRL